LCNNTGSAHKKIKSVDLGNGSEFTLINLLISSFVPLNIIILPSSLKPDQLEYERLFVPDSWVVGFE